MRPGSFFHTSRPALFGYRKNRRSLAFQWSARLGRCAARQEQALLDSFRDINIFASPDEPGPRLPTLLRARSFGLEVNSPGPLGTGSLISYVSTRWWCTLHPRNPDRFGGISMLSNPDVLRCCLKTPTFSKLGALPATDKKKGRPQGAKSLAPMCSPTWRHAVNGRCSGTPPPPTDEHGSAQTTEERRLVFLEKALCTYMGG